ncbi:hypothetical protein KKA94_03755 [Patescibacteria group bacterium]|nr:hypothetical protein [Patescibacteria group bacterium]
MVEPTTFLSFLISKEAMLIYFSCIISSAVSVVLAERWYNTHPEQRTTQTLLKNAFEIMVDIFGYLFMLALLIALAIQFLS